jgi:hypothetical protein
MRRHLTKVKDHTEVASLSNLRFLTLTDNGLLHLDRGP